MSRRHQRPRAAPIATIAPTPRGASTTEPPPLPRPTDDEIRTRAYLMWEQAGCPASDGSEFWLAAEHELLART